MPFCDYHAQCALGMWSETPIGPDCYGKKPDRLA